MTDTLHERLTQSVRRLIDVTIRSEADEGAVAKALALVDQTVEVLSTRLMHESFGMRTNHDGCATRSLRHSLSSTTRRAAFMPTCTLATATRDPPVMCTAGCAL